MPARIPAEYRSDQIVGLVAGRTQRQPVFKAAHAHYIKGGLEGDRVYFFEQTVDQRLYGHLLTARSLVSPSNHIFIMAEKRAGITLETVEIQPIPPSDIIGMV